MKKVSAIITTYNSEKSLLRVINSITNQQGINTDFTVELIIVDDCSTDTTRAILEENNIPYLSTPKNSGGPNAGRNIGLKAATGDYICIVDHDDEWHSNKVLSLLPHFDKASIVTSGYTVVDNSTGKTIDRVNPCPTGNNSLFYNTNTTFKARLTKQLQGQLTYLGSIMYKSNLKHILFEEEYGVVDFDWLLKLFHNYRHR
ncbi:MAG: glycosyltransferase [Sphingobacteriales bacterium JAD_PAG50586_3]|nr:MAG: glycosyltransferase [Sphingobacteriales bacterium JAD_PAG50586_3]